MKKKFMLTVCLLSILVLFSQSTSAQSNLGNGLIVYLPFNQSTTNNSPNRINGTDAICSGPNFSYDRFNKVNQAVYFDGINDRIELEKEISLQNFSLGFWYNTTMSASATMFHWEAAGLTLMMNQSTSDGKIVVNYTNPNGKNITLQTTSVGNNGKWHHLVLSFDGEKLQLYENGKKTKERIALLKNKTTKTKTGRLFIGSQAEHQSFYLGRLDEIVLYNRAITEAELSLLRSPSSLKFDKNLEHGLVFHFPLDGNGINKSTNAQFGFNGKAQGATASFNRYQEEKTAYQFDGKDDFINIGALAKHPSISVCAWVNTTATNFSNVIGWNGTGFDLQLNPPNGLGKFKLVLHLSLNETYSFTSPVDINDGNWHFIAFSFDGNALVGYLNGQQIYQNHQFGKNQALYYSDKANLSIAKSEIPRQSNFQGRLDDIRVYNRRLSNGEFLALYNEDTKNNAVEIKLLPYTAREVRIDFKHKTTEKAEIYLYNQSGKRLFKKKMRHLKKSLTIDLKEYAGDQFKVLVKIGEDQFSKKIKLKTSSLTKFY